MLHVITLGNHTFAAVKGSEGYEHMSFTLHEVFKEINTLIAAGKILVCDRLVELEFVLGSDYKVSC